MPKRFFNFERETKKRFCWKRKPIPHIRAHLTWYLSQSLTKRSRTSQTVHAIHSLEEYHGQNEIGRYIALQFRSISSQMPFVITLPFSTVADFGTSYRQLAFSDMTTNGKQGDIYAAIIVPHPATVYIQNTYRKVSQTLLTRLNFESYGILTCDPRFMLSRGCVLIETRYSQENRRLVLIKY